MSLLPVRRQQRRKADEEQDQHHQDGHHEDAAEFRLFVLQEINSYPVCTPGILDPLVQPEYTSGLRTPT